MNNLDLNEIPEKYHILFTSTWKDGNESTMSAMERADLNQLYLEYNKWQIQIAINKSSSTNEENKPIGFIKD